MNARKFLGVLTEKGQEERRSFNRFLNNLSRNINEEGGADIKKLLMENSENSRKLLGFDPKKYVKYTEDGDIVERSGAFIPEDDKEKIQKFREFNGLEKEKQRIDMIIFPNPFTEKLKNLF